MQIQRPGAVPDNTPIIIGSGQSVERLGNETPPLNSPMHLAAKACQNALKDGGVQPGEIDAIATIRLFSDSPGTWKSEFGGSTNPPESIARRIGASPSKRIYSNVGGNEPLQLLLELMQAIAGGEIKSALLTGAEAIANQRYAVRHGIMLDWQEDIEASLDDRTPIDRLVSIEEIHAGFNLPVRFYGAIEMLQAHQMGHDLRQHERFMGRFMASFSEIAAQNPYSQFSQAHSAHDITEASPRNYPISLPYLKRLIAQDAVNQAAAVLITSAGHARELGINPAQWIFLESFAHGADHALSQREDPARSEAMKRVLLSTLSQADQRMTDIDLIDIYSCFPCAVTAACEVLKLPTDGSIALTVTGGLPYFGGPGNNYSMHALAEMARRLRGDADRALITANGGMLSKHAAALLTSVCTQAQKIDWSDNSHFEVDCSDIAIRQYADNPQAGRIVTYTVATRKEKPDLGMIIADTATGERFLATSTDPAVTKELTASNSIGRKIEVHTLEKRRGFHFTTA
ncbi:hypothetical protein OAN12_00095 [Halioglobus sp.]|nr:hypothetical protein [Halioglobus sp.]